MRLPLLVPALILGSTVLAAAKLSPADFRRLDVDADGFLDTAEFTGSKEGAALKKALKSFAKLDADDDSQLSTVEALGKKAAALVPALSSQGSGSNSSPQSSSSFSTGSISSSWTILDVTSVVGWVSSLEERIDGARVISVADWLSTVEDAGTREAIEEVPGSGHRGGRTGD